MPSTYSFSSPILGEVVLRAKSPDQLPEGIGLGYVQLDGRGALKRAIYRKGEWRDHRFRSFRGRVTAWYQMEKPDGSPLF